MSELTKFFNTFLNESLNNWNPRTGDEPNARDALTRLAEAPYFIDQKTTVTRPGLVLLMYTDKSDMSEPLVLECNGTIVSIYKHIELKTPMNWIDANEAKEEDLNEDGSWKEPYFFSVAPKPTVVSYGMQVTLSDIEAQKNAIPEMNEETFGDLVKKHDQDVYLHEAVNGTHIKLWYWRNPVITQSAMPESECLTVTDDDEGAWMLSTTRKINAFESRWGALQQDFGTLFRECLPYVPYSGTDMSMQLDKRVTYTFIIKHPDNKIVTLYDIPSAVHVSSRSMDTFKETRPTNTDPATRVYTDNPNETVVSVTIVAFMDYDSIMNSAHGIKNMPHTKEGYVLSWPAADGLSVQRYKITNPRFKEALDLKGNNPDMRWRFLALNRDNDHEAIKKIAHLFPEYADMRVDVYRRLKDMARKVQTMYFKRFIKKPFVHQNLGQTFGWLTAQLHMEYKEKKKTNSSYVMNAANVLAYISSMEIKTQVYLIYHAWDDYKKYLEDSSAESAASSAASSGTATQPTRPTQILQRYSNDNFYAKIQALKPVLDGTDMSGKITGMLLELPKEYRLEVYNSPELLKSKVHEAMTVLIAHFETMEKEDEE